MHGKTIQIYLPEGDARSIKEAEIRESTAKAIVIPRVKLKEAEELDGLRGAGLYFLFGEDDKIGRPSVYIGESENLMDRLKQHVADPKKDFWIVAIAFFSTKSHLNKASFKYLENYCFEQASTANKSTLENSKEPARSHLSKSDECTALHFFEDMKILLGALGYSILDIVEPESQKKYYFKTKDADAIGIFGVDGFTVLKGSKANMEPTPSWNGMQYRDSLINDGVLVREGKVYVFTRDFTFKSPSGAGDVVAARSTNGWTGWKTKEGKTLHEIERGMRN